MAVIPISHRPSITARLNPPKPILSQLLAATNDPTHSGSTSKSTNTLTRVSTADEATTPASKGLSTGAKAGIGISVAIIVLSGIAILAWFIMKRIQRRRHELRMQALRRESERGMRNAAVFQLALPPHFLEHEDTSLPPKPPPKPPKPVAKPPTKRGFSWLNEKEVVVDWRANMNTRLSRWREKPSTDDFDSQKKRIGNLAEPQDSWI